MPLLNSKFSNFNFKFPKGFFFSDIDEKYTSYLKRHPIIFPNVTDYINYTVQSISWPAVNVSTSEQEFQDVTKTYKGGKSAMRYYDRQIDVTFATKEGYLNYFIMQDQFIKYWELGETDKMFLPNFNLYIMDHFGYSIMTMLFEDIVFSGISALELSFATNVPEFRTFSCTFNYKRVRFEKQLQ